MWEKVFRFWIASLHQEVLPHLHEKTSPKSQLYLFNGLHLPILVGIYQLPKDKKIDYWAQTIGVAICKPSEGITGKQARSRIIILAIKLLDVPMI